ncbi:MAG: response regulator [Lachnospiraceae bacterium]|nr:response regulator [Lachnospiraceae bacterium]
MHELRKERLVIALIILAQTGFIVETLFSGWELWVVPLIVLGIFAILWIHLSLKLKSSYREAVYFTLTAVPVFFVGSHENGLVNPAVLIALLMISFALFDRILYLNISLIEYVLIIACRIVMIHISGGNSDGHTVAENAAHFAVVLSTYILCRISVSDSRLKQEEMDFYRESVDKEHTDVGDFMANVSHELRTPVNVINGMTALVLKDVEREELTSIREACIRLTHQLDDIQDYTEVRRKELILTESDYMCDSLVNDAVTYYRSVEKKHKLGMFVDLSPATPAVLRGDIEKLHKILRLLLDNALKFTKKGGIYLKVLSEPRDYGVNLIIEVADTGIGMTRGQIARLSTGMYQANKKRTRSTGGIGLGFSIIYGFVRKMGGFVRIDSKKGQGTTVHLSIPQQVVDNSPCLSVKPDKVGDILYFIRNERIEVPQVREFNRNMTATLAAGLGLKMYATGDIKEFSRLINELNVTHVFANIADYNAEREVFDALAKEHYQVIVTTEDDRTKVDENGVLFVQVPCYGSTIVRIINGEYEDCTRGYINSEKLSFDGIKALIVDDEPMNLVVATGIFREYGLILDTAESGQEAVRKFSDGNFDIIFMDHMMPGMDGVEAMKNIRKAASESGRNPVIIALTANVLSGAREMFTKEGFDGFLAKPIDITEFERVMKIVLPEEMIKTKGGQANE